MLPTDTSRVAVPGGADLRPLHLALVSTYPPTKCGIGRFSHSLRTAWSQVAPNVRVEVARVLADPEHPVLSDAAVVFDPVSPLARRTAANRINRAQVAVLQHEFGVYGPDDGVGVLDLVQRITVPLVTVLHTVVQRPSRRQLEITRELADRGHVVVPTDGARTRLADTYRIDPASVTVIPHGSWWSPTPLPGGPRTRLITWGLLGPGKGIERCLRAVARLSTYPAPTLQIVGQTHPNVLSRSGQAYRRSLEALVTDLGLEERVTFVDRYVDDVELKGLVEAAHVVVIPYDNHEQICSGVLTEAVALGRPVVATGFPHAQELLAGGAGIVVPHTERGLAKGLRHLLTDDLAYSHAAGEAARLSGSLDWQHVAGRYLEVVHTVSRKVSVA